MSSTDVGSEEPAIAGGEVVRGFFNDAATGDPRVTVVERSDGRLTVCLNLDNGSTCNDGAVGQLAIVTDGRYLAAVAPASESVQLVKEGFAEGIPLPSEAGPSMRVVYTTINDDAFGRHLVALDGSGEDVAISPPLEW